MNNPQIFNHDTFGKLRAREEDGEVLFDLNDIAFSLGYTKESKGAKYLRKERIQKVIVNNEISTVVRDGQLHIFEDGLYEFVFEARTEASKAFRKWVTKEVIPSIRKTGSYSIEQPKPKTYAEMFMMSAEQLLDHEKRLDRVEQQVENTAEIISLNVIDWRKKANKILAKISESRGGDINHQEVRKQSYELLEQRAGCNLEIRLTNKKKKMALEGAARTRINKANKLDVISDDRRLTEIYLACIKDMAIKNRVDASELPKVLEEAE